MNAFKFKTNINCGGCVKAVTPYLDGVQNLNNWEVDTQAYDKVLTVKGDGLSSDDVIAAVQKAGYTINSI